MSSASTNPSLSTSTQQQATQGVKLPEQGGGGLQGYIGMWIDTDVKFQHGASFYVPAWPLLKSPLRNYQVGLPSTWYIPNNDDFTKALCPPGTPASNWSERGPVFRDVFQTMEGGLGNWYGVLAPTAAPKFSIGGTSNCYKTTVGSPGWGSQGSTASLLNMGTAQLSNNIIFPPEGLTFGANTNGQQLGYAYMPIPMLPKQTSPARTGDHSWTLFLNAKNFAGPVAFYIPNFWSKLSQSYLTINGRGLDSRPAIMDSVAMEVNTVPYFEATDSKGTTYTRIPALNFPVDKNGKTILAQGVTLYSADAFYNPIKLAFMKGSPIPTSFNASSQTALKPSCYADSLEFTQDPNNTPLTGLDQTVQTFSSKYNEPCAYGLKWVNARGTGVFPEYYKQSGTNRVAVSASQVPPETNLQTQTFTPAFPGSPYQVPSIATNKYWNKWVPNQPPVSVNLIDGTTVVYRWYKFVNQPSIASLGLTRAQKNSLQAKVERLHKSWPPQTNFMLPPPSGELVNLDPAQFVKPPAGLEVGYVPIVISQTIKQNTQANKPETMFMYKKSLEKPTQKDNTTEEPNNEVTKAKTKLSM